MVVVSFSMNKENLKRLAEHLMDMEPKRFDMDMFFLPEGKTGFWYRLRNRFFSSSEISNSVNCQQVHNALSAATEIPDFRIIKEDFFYSWPGGIFSWPQYGERIFGLERFTVEWDWLFDDRWRAIDNTPKGAAARIYYMLQDGVPRKFREGSREIIEAFPKEFKIFAYCADMYDCNWIKNE